MGSVALGVAGGAVLLACLLDLFVTIFNYDGFTFLAGRLHALLWAGLRGSSRLLPGRAGAAYLSLGSAAMLPITMLWWLALEVCGFAMMYLAGMSAQDWSTHGSGLLSAEGAFYLSGGDLTSLTFGDLVARTAAYRALVDLETVIGLATFTIGLAYVIAAFDALGTLTRLHGRVRRQAVTPNRPATMLARHFRDGHAPQLSTLLQSLVEDLADYDDALRRYPVVFYFHTRRDERSIPRVYAALGDVIELLRWGLPAAEPVTSDPYLLALLDEYLSTTDRLLRSFVGPVREQAPAPVPLEQFRAGAAADGSVAAFFRLQREAIHASGLSAEPDPDTAYGQYRQWLQFHHRRTLVVDRLAAALCYRRPQAETATG